MCGIVGILDPRRSRPAGNTNELLERMAVPITVRGPDGSGSWEDPACGISFHHRRLAIVDLSKHGVQPMASADSRYVITYNGEIYNHIEIADDLRGAGVRFRGHSDTEVLIEAVATWGLGRTLDRIDGMFAFALWDRSDRALTLARDRMGEKPLYYGTLGNGELVFGSSLDSLRIHPAFDQPIDRDALALYFRHKYVPAPWTIYKGISKLEPGTTVTVQADGDVGDSRPYWSLLDVAARGASFSGSEQDAVHELDRLVRRSVRQRMVADVPVGAFLSGGIDSATIVGAAQAESSSPIRTFTIGSSERDFDESDDARTIANHIGTDHTELIVTEADALAVVDGLAGIYDEPFADSSQIPTRIVSGMAREEVTVALSGDAGDELFGGYNRYLWAPAIWSKLDAVPVGPRSVAARAARRVPPRGWDRLAQLIPTRHRPQQLGLKISKVLDVADASSGEEVFHRLTSHWMTPEALVPGSREPLTLHTDPSLWPRDVSLTDHMMMIDALTYLPDDILCKVDRASMSVSLEARVPYLAREIVEFAFSLGDSLKIKDGISKWPLRQVLRRYVPDELMDRPKAGFGLPIDSWLRGPLRSWAEDRLLASSSTAVLNTELVRQTWEDHISGRRNNAYLLWDVLMFVDWCNHRGVVEFHDQRAWEPPDVR